MFEFQTLYVYVCFESETSDHACMKVCIHQAADLRLLSKYVYVSLSNLQSLLVSEDVKILIDRTQSLTFNIFVIEL